MSNYTTRSGWNARGGTVNDHLEISQEFAPDGIYWELKAKKALKALENNLGETASQAFIEQYWPGETQATWKEIFERVDARLNCKHEWQADTRGGVHTFMGEYDDDIVEIEFCIRCGERRN